MSRTEKLRVAGILAVAYALFLSYAYPGFLSIDSGQQLLEARAHVYSDWHPPAMAWLWGVCEHLIQGPLLMLLLQSIAFLAGLFLVLRRALAPTWAAIVAAVIFLFPPVIAPMAVIWKDSQMAGYLMLGFALLFEGTRARVIGILLMSLACAMRHNAPGAVLPLLFVLDGPARRIWRVAVIAGVFAVIVISSTALNKHLTDKPAYQWHVSIAPYDIAGIMHFGRFFSDEEMNRELVGTPLARTDHIAYKARTNGYSTRTWWDSLNGEGRVFFWPETDQQRDALARSWKHMVLANKWPYLHHRLAVFASTIGLDGEPLFGPVWFNDPPDDYIKAANLERVAPRQTAIGEALVWIATHTIWFYPWLYLAFAVVFVPLARKHLDILALYLSGIMYELTLLPFSTADNRYSHWLTVTTLVATIMLVRRRSRPARPAS
ncbi:MAG: hypothetical protein QM831_15900 [Kofleriaceae bacterium]